MALAESHVVKRGTNYGLQHGAEAVAWMGVQCAEWSKLPGNHTLGELAAFHASSVLKYAAPSVAACLGKPMKGDNPLHPRPITVVPVALENIGRAAPTTGQKAASQALAKFGASGRESTKTATWDAAPGLTSTARVVGRTAVVEFGTNEDVAKAEAYAAATLGTVIAYTGDRVLLRKTFTASSRDAFFTQQLLPVLGDNIVWRRATGGEFGINWPHGVLIYPANATLRTWEEVELKSGAFTVWKYWLCAQPRSPAVFYPLAH
jgi:hypothetical protein